MLLLNFSHPLTPEHITQVEALSRQPVQQVIELDVQFDTQTPFLPQMQELLAQLTLTPAQWQTEAIIINLPALNTIAALLLTELHGRMGYFPPVLRLRPIQGSLPPRYEVSELLNLQAIREDARHQRKAAAP